MNNLRYFDFGSSRSFLLLIARIAIVVLFIIFGYPKLTGFSGTVQYMTSLGAPMPMLAAIVAVEMEVTAAIRAGLFHPPPRGDLCLLYAVNSGDWSPLLGYDGRCGSAKYD